MMNKEELSSWALSNGWRQLGDHLCLGKPSRPAEVVVRLVLKATVVSIEIKKPAGQWQRVSGAPYTVIEADPDTGVPRGLGLVSIPGLTKLMQDNKDAQIFTGNHFTHSGTGK